MSLFTTTTIECTACETTSDFQAAGSVNADRRPDLRGEILDNVFQTVACPKCGEPLRLEPLALVELGRVGLGSGALELEQAGVVASQLELVLLELEPGLVLPELALVRPLLGLADQPTSWAP